MIVVTFFPVIMNQMYNYVWFVIKTKNCHYGHLPFNLKRKYNSRSAYFCDARGFCGDIYTKNRLCVLHLENYIPNSFQIEWDMIMMTVCLSTLNQMEFHLVQNRTENCHHDHIPFNLKGNRILVFSVHAHVSKHKHGSLAQRRMKSSNQP